MWFTNQSLPNRLKKEKLKIYDRQIDHLVYCVPNMLDAIEHFKETLGVEATIGGRHLNQGTINALINLGDKCYLEILAIDEENKDIKSPRWMGLDMATAPKITRWAISSEDVNQDSQVLQQYNPELGNIIDGSRVSPTGAMLKWKMTKPLATPEVEIAPFILDWSESAMHPTDNMVQSCALESVEFFSPENPKLNICLDGIFGNFQLIESKQPKIVATIRGPRGVVTI